MSYLTKLELEFIYKIADSESEVNNGVASSLSEFLCNKERAIDDVRYEMALELFEKLVKHKTHISLPVRLANKPLWQKHLEEIQSERWMIELQESSVAKFQEDKRKREAEEQAQIESDIKQHEQRSARRSILYEMLSAPTEEARQKQLEAYELLRKMRDE
ncbi:hypothetical protein [Priestia megaterium]|uniref:hypothetical protein n=1 Tax=Priestia megaterium TaxID=1404 RepID=UPI003457F6D3